MRPTPVDLALMKNTPVEMVPLHGEFHPLDRFGHRFLAAKDGLWLEARKPWGRVLWPLAQQAAVPMPFGRLKQSISPEFDLPRAMLLRFHEAALAANPKEVGAAIIWDSRARALHYHPCEPISSGIGTLRQRWPRLEPHESVAIDLHSHGPLDASFSMTDRADTGAEFVLAGVLGRVNEADPQVVLSLFVCGLELPLAEATSHLSELIADPLPTS